MKHTETEHSTRASHATPKDFFLWLGAVVALYGGLSAFITLIFAYINIAFPDALEYYSDPSHSGVQVAMATVIVLVPLALGLLLTIRRDIVREPGKANIWVRRWALVLTIFLAGAIAAVDLIVLLTGFLGGEITVRFILKAAIVLLVSIFVCLHFLADYWGYWTLHRRKVNIVGAAVGALAVLAVIGGFVLIGSPAQIRAIKIDQEKVSDLQNIQYQVTNYWQQKRALPVTLDALTDPLQGYHAPVAADGSAYEYSVTGPLSFELCATFSTASENAQPTQPYARGIDQDFMHPAERTCYSRNIDPDAYPPAPKS